MVSKEINNERTNTIQKSVPDFFQKWFSRCFSLTIFNREVSTSDGFCNDYLHSEYEYTDCKLQDFIEADQTAGEGKMPYYTSDVAPEGYYYIFVKYVRDPRTGKIRYASAYGKNAFRLKIKKKKSNQALVAGRIYTSTCYLI